MQLIELGENIWSEGSGYDKENNTKEYVFEQFEKLNLGNYMIIGNNTEDKTFNKGCMLKENL